MRGIILAGGRGTRLYPITKGVCKQLLPVYDKPLIYYPLTTLLQAGIRDILIITVREAIDGIQNLFGDGSAFGLSIQYEIQHEPKGIAEAFLIGENFIGGDPVSLILGDNIFFGQNLEVRLQDAIKRDSGATVFSFFVKDPERYGVFSFDSSGAPVRIIEKPQQFVSHWAVTGLYLYDGSVVERAKSLKLSDRGELEITDLNNIYLKENSLQVEQLGMGNAWLDTGTYESLLDAASFIKTIEERQGLKIGCVEEWCFRLGLIDSKQLRALVKTYPDAYQYYIEHYVLADN